MFQRPKKIGTLIVVAKYVLLPYIYLFLFNIPLFIYLLIYQPFKVLDLVHPSLFCWVNGTSPLYHRPQKNCLKYVVDIEVYLILCNQFIFLIYMYFIIISEKILPSRTCINGYLQNSTLTRMAKSGYCLVSTEYIFVYY